MGSLLSPLLAFPGVSMYFTLGGTQVLVVLMGQVTRKARNQQTTVQRPRFEFLVSLGGGAARPPDRLHTCVFALLPLRDEDQTTEPQRKDSSPFSSQTRARNEKNHGQWNQMQKSSHAEKVTRFARTPRCCPPAGDASRDIVAASYPHRSFERDRGTEMLFITSTRPPPPPPFLFG